MKRASTATWPAKFLVAILACAFVALAFPATAAAVEPEGMGYFRTRISPHDAGVFIDGSYRGTASMFAFREQALPLKPGVYDVELQHPRYKPLHAKVTIEAGLTSTLRRAMDQLNVDIRGPFGELRTDDFDNAAVYLNGKYYANSNEFKAPFGRSLLVKPGKYELKIVPADGTVGRTEQIEIRADMTLIVGREKMPTYEKE